MMIDIGALDVCYISYDEPCAEAFWADLKRKVPRARRIHGVKGFDAAHKAAARICETSQIVTIDGDNRVIDPDFFHQPFHLPDDGLHHVYSFRAKNAHNGLEYGNGGIKIWPRSLVLQMATHEAASDRRALVDFCWTLPYYQADRVLSEVHVTGSRYQAFRAGFREGVKINIERGVLAYDAYPDLSPAAALRRHIYRGNIERLQVWCSVGADVPNGRWGMLAARLGLCAVALDGFAPDQVQDYAWFERYWADNILPRYSDLGVFEQEMAALGALIVNRLELPVADLSPEASRFIKSIYRNPRSFGPADTAFSDAFAGS